MAPGDEVFAEVALPADARVSVTGFAGCIRCCWMRPCTRWC